MIPEKLLEIMKQDGVVAIATLGKDGPHMVNTWNSYIRISSDGRLFFLQVTCIRQRLTLPTTPMC